MDLPNQTFFTAEQYGNFSPLIKDYLSSSQTLRDFYTAFPNEAEWSVQAEKKLKEYNHREIVSGVLEKQMKSLKLSEKQIQNLAKFRLPNTATVTTGHQLNLLTGPLYFFYKILQTVKSCEELSQIHPEYNFVPVFWMATEDHDFEEINHFYHQNQMFIWDKNASGAVGRLNLDGLDVLFKKFLNQLPQTQNAESLKKLIEDSYLNSESLTEASRKLVQSLFGEYGLLVIDGDDPELKKLVVADFQDDLVNQTAFRNLTESNQKLAENGYSIQVNPREINLFYLGNGDIRERIIFENETYGVLNSSFEFNQDEILLELNAHPEKFSPNVLLRPLYQETVLPNIAYIGGSGEIAYWLQLKNYFESRNVLFPLLVVRNSVLILNKKQKSKLEKLQIEFENLFQPLHRLVSENVMRNAGLEIDFDGYEKQIRSVFDELTQKARSTDVSFGNMVNAQQVKQLKGLEKMKRRLVKAEKKKHSERVERIEKIHAELFPKGNLQERVMNFSDVWMENGKGFIKEIYDEIHPFEFRFIIKTLP